MMVKASAFKILQKHHFTSLLRSPLDDLEASSSTKKKQHKCS
jgi:hypothetical protein